MWFMNKSANPFVWLILHSPPHGLFSAALLLEQEGDVILNGFRIYLRRFPSLAKYHNVRVEADENFNAEDLSRAAANVVMIRVELKQESAIG